MSGESLAGGPARAGHRGRAGGGRGGAGGRGSQHATCTSDVHAQYVLFTGSQKGPSGVSTPGFRPTWTHVITLLTSNPFPGFRIGGKGW